MNLIDARKAHDLWFMRLNSRDAGTFRFETLLVCFKHKPGSAAPKKKSTGLFAGYANAHFDFSYPYLRLKQASMFFPRRVIGK